MRAFLGAVLAASVSVPTFGQSVVVVRADNQPTWGDPAPLHRELRLGVIDGPEELSFGRITGVAVSHNGHIWIADAQASSIRRFDPNGSILGSVGRNGEGPGEFRNLAGLQRMPDGRFAAWDSRLKRISLFTPAGEYIDAIRVPAQFEIGSSLDVFRIGLQGEMYVLGAALHPPDPTARVFYMRLTEVGPPDTIRIPPSDPRGPTRGGRVYPIGIMRPFSIATHSALSPAGHLVTGRNDRYVIHSRTSDGRPLRIERTFKPERVQDAERREAERLGEHFRRRSPDPGETSTAVPREKPPFWKLWVDQGGRVWVARHGRGMRVAETPSERERRIRFDNPPSEWWDPLVFDVIDSNGRFVGSVRFPNVRTRPMFAEGNGVWVVEEGEYGEQYVVRYQIGTPPS